MPSTFITIDLPIGRLRVRDDGPRDAPAVLFVHGFLVDGRLWERAADALADTHRVVVPDLPLGAHRTPVASGVELSPRAVARALANLADHLGLHDVTLVGNDTGGAICQFAIDAYPERFARLVLTNCDAFDVFPPFPYDGVHLLKRVPGGLSTVFQSLRLRVGRHLGLGVLSEQGIPDDVLRAWSQPFLTDARIRRDTRTFLLGARKADLLDLSTRLGRYPGPVLLTWAPADRFFTIALARRLQAAFRDARIVEIPASRTFVPWDQPQRLAAEIRAFVAAPASDQAGEAAVAGAGSHSAG